MDADRALSAAELFDAIGRRYEEAFGRSPVVEEAVAMLLDALPPRANVLDVGSGTGRPVAEALAAAGHRVVGIDVSATMVELARANVPDAEFEQADVLDWSTPSGTWDAVCAFFPFLQMSRADTETALRRIAEWLVPGGWFALVTVPADVENLPLTFLGHPALVTSFAAPDLVALVRSAGLDVVDSRTETFAPEGDQPPEEHLLIMARSSA